MKATTQPAGTRLPGPIELLRAWLSGSAPQRVALPEDVPEGEWANWSHNQRAQPKTIVQPASLDALRAVVAEASGRVRVVGAGHSFTGLVPTDGTLVSLDRLAPVESVSDSTAPDSTAPDLTTPDLTTPVESTAVDPVKSIDPAACTAWLGAGSRLRDLSRALDAHGLAFRNLGDIDCQSLAGAVSTATHGTGKELPCLAAEIIGVRLMTAGGDLICATRDTDADILRAAQVSLGALGILVEAQLLLRHRYFLRRKVWFAPLEDTLATAYTLWNKHRNFEFFYIPFSGYCMCISHDIAHARPTARPEVDDDQSVMLLKKTRDLTHWNRGLRRALIRLAIRAQPAEDTVGLSWRLLANERNVPFNEMEYHLPVATALDVLSRIIAYVEAERPDIFFPIEVRQTRGDEAWLSPFQGGNRVSIAIHSYFADPFDFFFTGIEPIFRQAGGRPHWGKLHSLTATDLADLYPDLGRFQRLRRELDPRGTFLNAHTASLWGERFDG